MKTNIVNNINEDKIWKICYKINLCDKAIERHCMRRPFLKFGSYYNEWKRILNDYDNIKFDLYNELSKAITK